MTLGIAALAEHWLNKVKSDGSTYNVDARPAFYTPSFRPLLSGAQSLSLKVTVTF